MLIGIIKIIIGVGAVFGLYLLYLVVKDEAEIKKIDRILTRKEKDNR